MARDVTLLVGTTKGLFLITGEDGAGWTVSGPHCDGWPINHAAHDPATGTIWAGGGSEWNGAGIWRSDDAGRTWSVTRLTRGKIDDWAEKDPDFAKMIGWDHPELPFEDQFHSVWVLSHDHGVLRAGTNPAKLLQSTDGGATWEDVDALSNHPTRDDWGPGAAGMVLHTIVVDPKVPSKIWTAISAAGVFASEDGGASWERRNRMSNADACGQAHDHPAAPSGGETGHCVHNVMRARTETGDLLYQQNHHGVFRSSDGGRNWDDVTQGLPSTFGFPIRVHPHDPQMIWTIPLNGDSQGRYPPDAKAAVWCSRDGGQSWVAQRNGLPQTSCFFTVLRQAMAGDERQEAGLYFGTNTGSVFASTNEGETWDEIARHLPTILGVEAIDRGTAA